MAEKTAISWTDSTQNFWIGCQKVSPGCKFCYAEELMTKKPRWANTWGPTTASERIRTSADNWKNPYRWNKKAAKQVQQWHVFVQSLSDFAEDHPAVHEWRMEASIIMEDTKNLIYQVLSKRPENYHRLMLPSWMRHGWPSHVWAGTSVENQETADQRIPHLLRVQARVKFLSVEPLLGPIDLTGYLRDHEWQHGVPGGINWVIIGGESGNNARACYTDWIRNIVHQCQSAGVDVWVKQLGRVVGLDIGNGGYFLNLKDPHGADWDEWPQELSNLRIRERPE